MGGYGDAVSLAQQTGNTPNTGPVRRLTWHLGITLNLKQGTISDLGVFARTNMNDGGKETYKFTDINQPMLAGFSLEGNRWGYPNDTFGATVVVNGLSRAARQYFAAGGMGVLAGDGTPNHGTERVTELYYDQATIKHLILGLNY